MSQIRRTNTPAANYFLTVISYRCQTILCDTPIREALREAIIAVRKTRPFVVDAWVLLPDHLHFWFPRRSVGTRKFSLSRHESGVIRYAITLRANSFQLLWPLK